MNIQYPRAPLVLRLSVCFYQYLSLHYLSDSLQTSYFVTIKKKHMTIFEWQSYRTAEQRPAFAAFLRKESALSRTRNFPEVFYRPVCDFLENLPQTNIRIVRSIHTHMRARAYAHMTHARIIQRFYPFVSRLYSPKGSV